MVRLFLSEHRATRSLLLSRSLANRQAPCQLTPISSRSSLKVLHHVFFAPPPPLSSAVFWHPVHCCMGGSLFLPSDNVASHFLVFVVTMSWSRSMPALLVTCSFVTWSHHEVSRIVRRQRRWKTSSLSAIKAVLFHVSHLLIKLKGTFFDTAVGPRPNCARMCALRRDWLSHKHFFYPRHPILIETRSYRRPSGRVQAVRCGQITYASLRFAFWENVTLSTSTHRHYDESVHRIKQLTRGSNTIPYHRL